MKAKAFSRTMCALFLLFVVSGLANCGGSSSNVQSPPPPTLAIAATSGSGQTGTVGDAFTNMLAATVTSNGTAASGVTVTFTPVPGSAGQSCTPSATAVATSHVSASNPSVGVKGIERAVALGARILLPIRDQFYGDRSGSIADPFEQAWTVATHKEDLSPEEIRQRFRDSLRGS